MNARQAQEAKYKNMAHMFEEAKKARNEQKKIQAMRSNAANARKQNLYQLAQEQHEATKLRMIKLFHEKHAEVQQDKTKLGKLRAESQHWKSEISSVQQKLVQDLKDNRQISRLQAAASHARQIQQSRDDFGKKVGDVTKQMKRFNEIKVDSMRQQFEADRAASAERRTHARQNWMRSNANSREETKSTLDRAKKIEAAILLEERKQLLAFEKILHSRY
jgi:hypothetical protein